MKNYDEMINSVFDRINEYEVEHKRKRKVITRTVTSMCCFCFVALLGIGMWQSGLFNTARPSIVDDGNSTDPGTDKTGFANPGNNESIGTPPDAPIIWGEENDEFQDAGFGTWNGKMVTSSLNEVLSDEKNKDCLIAIGVSFELDHEFVYKGKTISEYEAAVDDARRFIGRLGELLKIGDELKYGEALYKTGTPDGEKWAKQLYDETVERIGKDVLSTYIVDGEFLKEKLEADIAEYGEHESCRIACEEAYEACYQVVIDAAAKRLEEQSIHYEKRNGALVIYATAEELSALKIDNVLFYGLALKDGEGMDMAEAQISEY